jgi:hypothetical protein
MENIEKKGLLTRIQDYLDSPKGRILLNYLYSWGAAVVILGALFKLTHIKGANLMLFIGMGTEVLVFFISGFERPYIPGKEDEEEDAPRLRGNIIINGTAQAAPVQQSAVPAAAPAEDSTNDVTVEVPQIAPTHVPIASERRACLAFGRLPSSSRRSAFAATPMSVPTVSKISTYRKEKTITTN